MIFIRVLRSFLQASPPERSPDATIFLLGASGSASFQVTTPNLPPMIGVTYHTQGLVLDPTLNALGVSMSAAATAVLGL